MSAWKVAALLGKLAMRHPVLLSLSILASVGVAVAGVLSISLVLPFLASLGGAAGEASFQGSPLGFFVPLFDGMDEVEKIRTIALMLLGIQVFRSALSYTESRLSAYLKILAEQDLRQMVFDELMAVELGYVQRERSANLFNILHTYPQKTATILDQYLAGLTKAISGFSLFLVLLALSWQLTLVALALGLVSMLAIANLNKVIKRMGRHINESRVRLHQTSLESLAGLRLIRTFAREDHAKARFLRDVRILRRQSFRRSSLTSAMPQLHALLNMVLFTVLIFSATFILDPGNGGSWILQLTLFIVVMSRLIAPITSFTRKRAEITEKLPAAEEVIRFLEADKPILKDGKRTFDRLRHGIRFEDVHYGYTADRPEVLRGVTLDVKRGSKIALVGSSGSGKSTLLLLLSRLADPTAGRVLVDGIDMREFRARSWRARVAVVTQETFLFNDTVRENIRYGRPDATDAEVEEAAKLARAHDFIVEMEDSYDTIVGDRGSRLSGGQAQRLAIARAALADPDVLVLDEATSALDATTEHLVQAALDAASRDRTVVAVAHRLATVRDADVIYVLDQGAVVQAGTHEELLAQPGLYQDLVRMQDLTGEPRPARQRQAPVEAEHATSAVAAPLEPLRMVLSVNGRTTAALVRGGFVLRDALPLSLAAGPEDADRRLAGLAGDGVVVWPGGEFGCARLDGETHHDVPLFSGGATNEPEKRVRVREARLRAPPTIQ